MCCGGTSVALWVARREATVYTGGAHSHVLTLKPVAAPVVDGPWEGFALGSIAVDMAPMRVNPTSNRPAWVCCPSGLASATLCGNASAPPPCLKRAIVCCRYRTARRLRARGVGQISHLNCVVTTVASAATSSAITAARNLGRRPLVFLGTLRSCCLRWGDSCSM